MEKNTSTLNKALPASAETCKVPYIINNRYTREEAIETAAKHAVEITAELNEELTYNRCRISYGITCEPGEWEVYIPLHLHQDSSKPRTKGRGKGYRMLMAHASDMEYTVPPEVMKCVASGLTSRQFTELFKQLRKVEALLDDEYPSVPQHIEDAAASWPHSDLYEMDDVKAFVEYDEWLDYIHILGMRGLDVGPFVRSAVFLRVYGGIVSEIISECRAKAWHDEEAVDEVYRKAKEMMIKK